MGPTARRDISSQRTRRFDGTRTAIDNDAVDDLRSVLIQDGTKGMPLGATGMNLGDLGAAGWNVFDGRFTMPLMILRQSAVDANIATMADYCRARGVWLCPHGKTTMAPQLFLRQVEAGAWGLTAATPAHLRVYRRYGVARILYANQLVEQAVMDWIAQQVVRDPSFEFYCLADSPESVSILDRGFARHSLAEQVRVLVEVGYAGGRCGVRDASTALEIARLVDRSSALALCGVECFEGLISVSDGLHDVDRFLVKVRDVAIDLLDRTSLCDQGEIIITAGGSAYFDRVIEVFVRGWPRETSARVVLRSGCYITHDGGFYRDVSPLGARRAGGAILQDGIEVWSAVLSRPESGLAIAGMGRRDAPEDMGMPIPIKRCRIGGSPTRLVGATVIALNDQHAHIAIAPDVDLQPGDLVGCAISHPCGAFDRWHIIPVIDDEYTVCDAVATLF